MSRKLKVETRGKTLKIVFGSRKAAQKAKAHVEAILDEGAYHGVSPEDTLHFYHHTLDLIRVQAEEEGSFLSRMKRGEVAGVF
jgi:hypothetical protein